MGRKWVVELNKTVEFPWKRGKYSIALQSVQLENLNDVGIRSKLINICVSPKITDSTYLPNKIPVPAIKSYFVKGNKSINDYSECKEYVTIDLSGTDILDFYVLDIAGQPVPRLTGFLILDVQQHNV